MMPELSASAEVIATELATRGVAVVREFLGPKLVAEIAGDYERAPKPRGRMLDMATRDLSKMYDAYTPIGPSVMAAMAPRLQQLSELLHHPVRDPFLLINGLYADTSRMSFGLHQDVHPIFMFQDPTNYINVWVPFIKPDPARSNLCVIPCDALRERVPELAEELVGPRADPHGISQEGETATFANLRTDTARSVPLSLDTLVDTPHLEAGDALVMRADVIHRTQDVDTLRVAASFRLVKADLEVRVDRLLSGGAAKRRELTNVKSAYARIIAEFKRRATDAMSAADVLACVRAQTPLSKEDRELFDRTLVEWESAARSG